MAKEFKTKKSSKKRQWDQGQDAIDAVAYTDIKVFSIDQKKLKIVRMGLTG